MRGRRCVGVEEMRESRDGIELGVHRGESVRWDWDSCDGGRIRVWQFCHVVVVVVDHGRIAIGVLCVGHGNVAGFW